MLGFVFDAIHGQHIYHQSVITSVDSSFFTTLNCLHLHLIHRKWCSIWSCVNVILSHWYYGSSGIIKLDTLTWKRGIMKLYNCDVYSWCEMILHLTRSSTALHNIPEGHCLFSCVSTVRLKLKFCCVEYILSTQSHHWMSSYKRSISLKK